MILKPTPRTAPESLAKELAALFLLTASAVWTGFAFTYGGEQKPFILHPLVAIGLVATLFPFRKEVASKRAVQVTMGLLGIWLAGAVSVVWIPFAAAFVLAYVLRFLARELEHLRLPGGRVLHVPRFLVRAGLGVGFLAVLLLLVFVVLPNFAGQMVQLAHGFRVAYQTVLLDHVESVPIENLSADSPPTLDSDISVNGSAQWTAGAPLFPSVVQEMRMKGVRTVPIRVESGLSKWIREAEWLHAPLQYLGLMDENLNNTLPDYVRQRLTSVSDLVTIVAGWLLDRSAKLLAGTLGFLVTMIFTVIVMIYLLSGYNSYIERFFTILPEDRRERARQIASRLDANMKAFLRGQFLVMAIVAVLSAIAYSLAGIPFALLVGIVGGVCNVIPNVGMFLTAVFAVCSLLIGAAADVQPPILFSFFISGLQGFLIRLTLIPAALFLVQTIDNSLVSPRVMSQAMNVDPLMIMFAVLLGGTLFGFWGVLLALPALVVIKSFQQSEAGKT